MQAGNKLITTLSICFFLLSCAVPLFGQATLTLSTASATGADIGVAELTGQVILTVSSGSTVAAPLLIQYSAPITNNSASEISIVGTGGLALIAPSPDLDRANGVVRINVPAGGAVSDHIQIVGVRVALAGQGLSNVTVHVTSPSANGNTILAGQESALVIDSIRQPFTVNFDADSIRLNNLTAASASSTIGVAEVYPGAFSSAVGTFGQTVVTRIRFNPFPSIPQGVTITFAKTATSSETGATLTTLSGQDETVPRADGSTSVIYSYTAGTNSDLTIESFQVGITVTVKPPSGTGSIQFQATLLPIGAVVPDAQFSSTDIPRYIEHPVPDETDLQTGTVKLAFPFSAQTQAGVFTGIALTNPIPFRVKVSLAAYDAAGKLISGTGITNPVNLIMPRSGQVARVATEIFGSSFNSSTSGTIVATGTTSVLPGFYLEGGSDSLGGLDGATADLVPVRNWVWPEVFHQGSSPATIFRLYNPASAEAAAALRLYDSSGSLRATATVTVPAGGTLIRDIDSIFMVKVAALEGGYVTGATDIGLVVSERFGDTSSSNALQGQLAVPRSRFLVPHFVVGGGYSTELNLVNMDSARAAQLTLTAYDNRGVDIGGGPVNIFIAPGNQYTQMVDRTFPALSGSFTNGYIRIDTATSYQGPFATFTPIVGSVRFTSAGGHGSTALSIFLPASSDFVYSHVAQNSGYFTGVALVNPNSTAISVNLEVLAADGTSVGATSLQLQPGQKVAKLVYELVPASAGQSGGYVHVQSTLPITSYSLFGTDDGNQLSAIPPQSVY